MVDWSAWFLVAWFVCTEIFFVYISMNEKNCSNKSPWYAIKFVAVFFGFFIGGFALGAVYIIYEDWANIVSHFYNYGIYYALVVVFLGINKHIHMAIVKNHKPIRKKRKKRSKKK